MVPDFEPQPPLTRKFLERLEGKSVLLVEDSPDAQLLVRVLFRSLTTDLTVVDNGADALDAVSKKHFDLILMDLDMPILDGFQTITELKRRAVAIPTVALSAHAMSHIRESCEHFGFDGLLTKPFSMLALERLMIDNLLTIADS